MKIKTEEASYPKAVDTIRIVIADDHPVVRIGVANMLSADNNLTIVAEANDGDEAIERVFEHHPDILLLDLAMPKLPGLDTMRTLLDGHSSTRIILLTSKIETLQIIEALQRGAHGIVLKDALAENLHEAIHAVAAGLYWVGGRSMKNPSGVIQELIGKNAQSKHKSYGLTPREMQVLSCIVEGCTNRDIAQQFSLSEETVKRHLSNIFDKTGVSTRLELAMFAIAHHLIQLDV